MKMMKLIKEGVLTIIPESEQKKLGYEIINENPYIYYLSDSTKKGFKYIYLNQKRKILFDIYIKDIFTLKEGKELFPELFL